MPGKPSAESIRDLRVKLVNAQYQLRKADFSVLVVLAGNDPAGCDQLIDRLQEWMDSRYLDVWFFDRPDERERVRPEFWRYWRVMPPKGRIGIFAGAWTTRLMADRILGRITDAAYRERVRHINAFERMLSLNGTLMLNLWVQTPRRQIADADELDADWAACRRPDTDEGLLHRILKDTGGAVPWIRISDPGRKRREQRAAETLLKAVATRLGEGNDTGHVTTPPPPPENIPDSLARVDLSAALPYKQYRRRLDRLQNRLRDWSLDNRRSGRSAVMLFEGWDAAGKGGAIRRITQAVSARDAKVYPISAPTDEELARPYLWRFWRHLPGRGRIAIFDRSWYGRVLVERVEGLAREDEWRRAYQEINDFEAQIVEFGTPVWKFWLHIDPDEQMKRFIARESTSYKKYKITEDDYRNLENRELYTLAVNEMIHRTDTAHAPWHLIAANDKRRARVRIIETILGDA